MHCLLLAQAIGNVIWVTPHTLLLSGRDQPSEGSVAFVETWEYETDLIQGLVGPKFYCIQTQRSHLATMRCYFSLQTSSVKP